MKYMDVTIGNGCASPIFKCPISVQIMSLTIGRNVRCAESGALNIKKWTLISTLTITKEKIGGRNKSQTGGIVE
jgi:hypothetical protein